mgnify:FL=1
MNKSTPSDPSPYRENIAASRRGADRAIDHQIQLMLFAIELERQVEENEAKDQTIEDYRQKVIDMEHYHTKELGDIKNFFEASVKEQAVP